MKASFIYSLGILLLMIAGNSCSKDQSKTPADETNTPAFVRTAARGGTTAAYFSFVNESNSRDTLLSVSSPSAELAQVHESYESEDGMMGMREGKNLIIQPGDTITFKRGGSHIMLMQLNRDLGAGDSVRVSMEFARMGSVSKILAVQNN